MKTDKEHERKREEFNRLCEKDFESVKLTTNEKQVHILWKRKLRKKMKRLEIKKEE